MFAIRTRHTEHGYAENEPSEEQKKREKRSGEGPLGQGRGREEERGWRRAGEEDAVRGQRRRRLRHRRRVGQGPRRRLPLVQPSLSRISPAPVTRDTRVLFPASKPTREDCGCCCLPVVSFHSFLRPHRPWPPRQLSLENGSLSRLLLRHGCTLLCPRAHVDQLDFYPV